GVAAECRGDRRLARHGGLRALEREETGMFDLTGRCALVTGASGDIGRAIVETLHAAGATVALSGTRVAKLEALAAELGERVHVAPGDLATGPSAESVAKLAEEAMGSIDILVNNAGLTRDGLSMRMRDEDFETVLEVNLVSAFRLSRAALRGMMRRRWGRIVNITSGVGHTGNPGQANYAAPKAGRTGMATARAQAGPTRG